MGRKLLLSPVEFMEDGWFRVTKPADEATLKPVGEVIEDNSCFSDDFQGDEIKGWRSWEEKDWTRYQKSEKGRAATACR